MISNAFDMIFDSPLDSTYEIITCLPRGEIGILVGISYFSPKHKKSIPVII